MKRILLIAFAMMSINAVAQEKHESERLNYTPEQRATLQTKKITLALDLTEGQQEQVSALHIAQAKMRQTEIEKRKVRKKEAKKPTSEERYAMKAERLDRQIAHKAKMKKILSAEQYTRWEKMALRKSKHRKRKGKRKDSER